MARFHSKEQGSYEGIEERRKQEREDSSLFGSSQSEYMANMPTKVIFKEVSKPYSALDSNLDDTMKGVDRQIETDHSDARRHMKPKKV